MGKRCTKAMDVNCVFYICKLIMESDFTSAFLEACTRIGDSPHLYYYRYRRGCFLEAALGDSTLTARPSNDYAAAAGDALAASTVSAGLLYGFPRAGGFSRKMCSYAESAAMYDAYIRCVISHFDYVPVFLDEVSHELEMVAAGVGGAEDEFFRACVGFLRFSNLMRSLIQAADAETRYFADILGINPLSEQIGPVCASISQVIGMADQIRAALKEGKNQASQFAELKTSMSVLKTAIPNYTSLYSQLLDCLRSKFDLLYNDDEMGYKEFISFLRELISPIHDILLYAIESSMYSFEFGINLIRKMRELFNNLFWIVESAIRLTRFRSNYSECINKIMEMHENITPCLNNLISGFMDLLGCTPSVFQKIINEYLTAKFQVILDLNKEFNEKFNRFNTLLQNDEKSMLFSPVSMSRTSSPLTIMAIPIIKTIQKIAKKLMESDFDIENDMHTFVSTIPKLIENLNSKIESSPKIFTKQALLQKKVLIRKSLKEFVYYISKFQENKEQPLLQARCGLLAIELSQSLMTFETHTKFIKYLESEKQILLQFTIGYMNEKLAILPKLLNNLCSKFGIIESNSPIESLLVYTIDLIEKTINIFSNLPKDDQLESCKICLKQYMAICIPFSSLYLLLSTLNIQQNNEYNSIIAIIENFYGIIQLFVQIFQRLFALKMYHGYGVLLKYGDRLISYLQLLNKFTSKTTNAGDKLKRFQTNIANSKIELKKVKINYMPDSLILLMNKIKNKIKVFSEIKMLLNPDSDVIPIFQENYKKSLDYLYYILDFLTSDMKYFNELNLLKGEHNVSDLSIGPLFLHTYCTVNQELQIFMTNFQINNQDTSIYAYNLILYLLMLANLLKLTDVEESKDVPDYFEKYSCVIYEYSLISSLGDQNAFKRISTTTKSLIKILTSLKPICEKICRIYLRANNIENCITQKSPIDLEKTVNNSNVSVQLPQKIKTHEKNSIESPVFSNLLQIQQQITNQSNNIIQTNEYEVERNIQIDQNLKLRGQVNVEFKTENNVIDSVIESINDKEKITKEFASLNAKLESIQKAKEEKEKKIIKIESEKRGLSEKILIEEQKRKEAENEKRKIEKMLKEKSLIDVKTVNELKEKLKEANENLKKQKEIEKNNKLITENLRINLQIEKENAELELLNLQKNIKMNYEEEIKAKDELNQRLKMTEESKVQLEKELQQTVLKHQKEESQREKDYQELLQKLHQQNNEQQKKIVQLQINKQREIDELLKQKNKEKQIELKEKISEQSKIKEQLEEERRKRKEIEEKLQKAEEEKERILKEFENEKQKILKDVLEENRKLQEESKLEKEKLLKQAEEEKLKHLNNAGKEKLLNDVEKERVKIEQDIVTKEQNIDNKTEQINVISIKETKKDIFNDPNIQKENLFEKLFPPSAVTGIIEQIPSLDMNLNNKFPKLFKLSQNNQHGNDTLKSYFPSKDSPFYSIIQPFHTLTENTPSEIKTSKFSNLVLALEPPQYQFNDCNLINENDIQTNNEEEDLLFPDPFGENDFDDNEFYDSIYDFDDEEEEEEERPIPFPFPPPKRN